MFARIKKNTGTERKSVLICHSIRLGEKIKQVTVKVMGHTSIASEQLKLYGQAESWILENAETWLKDYLPKKSELRMKHKISLLNLEEHKRLNVGIPDIFGVLYNRLGFNDLLSGNHAETLKKVIFSRLLEPGSKRKLSQLHEDNFGEELPVDRIYRMMDSLFNKESLIQKKVFNATKQACDNKVSLVLFDVTTLSFETVSEDEIRAFGFSKDCKFNTTQVVLALATTPEGLPVGYKLFPGNTAESKTLIESINQWKEIISIDKVTVVGDRAMMSSKNIELLESVGFSYVIASPLKKLNKATKEEVLNAKNYIINAEESLDITKYKVIDFEENKKIIVTYSPKRAAKDKKDREKLIVKLEKKLKTCKSPKRLINNQGYLKFTEIKGNAVANINTEKVCEDSRWDGLHGVITNIDTNNPAALYAKYRKLWVIEESFRINKHTLKMRPIYHFTTERITTHVAICYMLFALIRHAQFALSKNGYRFSAQRIIDAVKGIQASVYKDITNDNHYRIMSAINDDAKIIYDTFKVAKNSRVMQLKKQGSL